MFTDLPADRRRRERMVRDQLEGCSDLRVRCALAAVPRHNFLPIELQASAYADTPLAIGSGQTISQPSVVAAMLARVRVQPGDRVLDVGAGSGYTAALFAQLCAPGGTVLAIERHARLVAEARPRLLETAPAVVLLHGDGLAADGVPGDAPFDVIHVGAACDQIPSALLARLAPAGRLIAPVGPHDGTQRLLFIDHGIHQWLDEVWFVPGLPGAVDDFS